MKRMRRYDRGIGDNETIEAILQEAKFGEPAFALEGEPYLVAMNYGVVREPGGTLRLYFHSAQAGWFWL